MFFVFWCLMFFSGFPLYVFCVFFVGFGVCSCSCSLFSGVSCFFLGSRFMSSVSFLLGLACVLVHVLCFLVSHVFFWVPALCLLCLFCWVWRVFLFMFFVFWCLMFFSGFPLYVFCVFFVGFG